MDDPNLGTLTTVPESSHGKTPAPVIVAEMSHQTLEYGGMPDELPDGWPAALYQRMQRGEISYRGALALLASPIPEMSKESRTKYPYPGTDGHTLEEVHALRVAYDNARYKAETEQENTR